MSLLDDFLVRAALAALGVALAAGPLGCLVVWRRMAYFGDATAHAAILGVALSLFFSMSVIVGILVVCTLMAGLVWVSTGRSFAEDTMLGVLAHSALALGLVAVSFLPGQRIDLSAYLFGDILAVSKGDLAVIWGGGMAVLTLIWLRWSALLTATLNPDLAFAAGLNPRREGLVLTLALAVTVAVAIKVVGALLIGALLIIPAAAARPLAGTPERMALAAVGIAAISGLGGLWAAFVFDTPAGPTIVTIAALIFALSALGGLVRSVLR